MIHNSLHITKYHKIVYLAACSCGWHGTETTNEDTAKLQLAVHRYNPDFQSQFDVAPRH